MPRKPVDPKPAVSYPRRTAAELAEALGVHRNTIAAWRKEGAPAALDEFQWRTWAAARSATGKGYDCPRDPVPELLELLSNAGVGDYRRRQAIHAPVLGTGDAPEPGIPQAPPKDPVAVTSEERKALADALIAESKARGAQREEDLRWHRLVSVEALHPLLDAWLLSLDLVVFTALRDLCDEVSPIPEVRAAIRGALDRRLRTSRDQLAGDLLKHLETYLTNLAKSA